MPTKQSKLSGILNINKPQGFTSHDVVARVRSLSGQRKVGHTGTLDPLATGVLLVCLGQATRLIEYLQPSLKRYRATIRFGIATDTLDAEGQVVAEHDPSSLNEAQLRQVLPAFMGEIKQIPPIFSALKKNGQPFYKLARAGLPVKVKPRWVTIHALDWVAWQPPDLTLDILCAPGTYIRSLARDLGDAVDTGAHLAGLTRTANGQWLLAEAVSLAELDREVKADPAAWLKYLHPPDRAVAQLPRVILTAENAVSVKHGRPIEISGFEANSATVNQETNRGLLRAYAPNGDFLAILTQAKSNDKLWQPKKVFHFGD